MDKKKETEVITVDIGKLFKYYLKHWWSFLICAAAVGLITAVISAFIITPQYKATVSVYVNNAKSSQGVETISSSNLSTAQRLVSTYVNIIKSNTVLEAVIEEGNLNCKPADVRKIMTAEQIGDTEMFTVSILHPVPETASYIANTIANVAPGLISDFVEGSSTKIIDFADIPQKQFSPNIVKNVVVAVVLGVIAAGIILTFEFIFNMKITTEDDISSYFDAPVLGSIPSFQLVENKKNASKDRR